MRPEDFSIWLGIDVGKTDHWASAINQLGEQVFSRALPNDEAKLRQVDEDEAELSMLTGFDDDLTRQITQTVTGTVTNAAATVIAHLAATLQALYHQRQDVQTQIESLLTHHPLYPVLTSLPGVGVRTCAVIIAEIAGKDFSTAAALAHRRTTVIYAMLRDHTTYEPQLIKQAA